MYSLYANPRIKIDFIVVFDSITITMEITSYIYNIHYTAYNIYDNRIIVVEYITSSVLQLLYSLCLCHS